MRWCAQVVELPQSVLAARYRTIARQQDSAPSWMPCWRGMCVISSPRFCCMAGVAAPLCLRVSDFEAVCARGADPTSRSSRAALAPLRSRLF